VIDLTSSNKAPVNQPAPVYTAPSQAVVSNALPKSVPAVTNSNAADQQLIQIWQKASKAERQKFMTWLADQ
jgi:uncharacterized protein YccT (UPF0319 family)